MDGFNHFCGEHGLFTIHEVFEEVYGDIVVRWQVYTNISRKEVIHFSLASILGCKLFRRYLSILLNLCVDRLHRRVVAIHL